MKKNNNKGFTLAELLIVVAIIAVLVAIAIPIFTTQLEKAREATDLANVRSAYAEAVTSALTGDTTKTYTVTYTLKSDTSDCKSTGDVAGVAVADILMKDTCTIIVKGDGSSATINDKAAKISFNVTESAS